MSEAHAAGPSALAATLSLGAQYDSNVSIDDADINLRQGDAGLLVAGAATYTPLSNRRASIRLGYAYDGIFNQDLHDYDLEIHALSASGTYRIGDVQAGLDYRYSNVQLGRAPYLVMHSISPSASSFVSEHLFLRGAYTFTDRQFRTFDRLDGTTEATTFDAYRFFAKRKGYAAVGLRQESEETRDPQFRFDGWQANLRAQVPFAVAGTKIKARGSFAYAERYYDDITPSIGLNRKEQRYSWAASLEFGITGRLSFRPQLRLTDRDSNVPVYDYRETVVSTLLSLKI